MYQAYVLVGKNMADFEPHRREAPPDKKYDSKYLKLGELLYI